MFIKHAAVLDQLCNRKQAIIDWSTSNSAICCCQHWKAFKSAALSPSDPHWVLALAGSLLKSLVSAELAVIAEGSLLNKVFPSKKEYHNQLRQGLQRGPNATVYHPFPDRISRNSATNFGPSIPTTSLATLLNPLFLNFNQPLKGPSSTVKANTLHPSAFNVRVSTIKPLNKHSKTLPFSNLCPWILRPWSHPS